MFQEKSFIMHVGVARRSPKKETDKLSIAFPAREMYKPHTATP